MSRSQPPAAAGGRKPSRPPRKETEFTLYGLNACRQAFQARPQDLLRLFFHKRRARDVAVMKKWCAEHRLPYRQLEEAELERVAGGVHHEGVVLVMRPPPLRSAYDLVEQGVPQDGLVVAFDRIENTHNLGALLRSCAYFGVAGCLLSREEGQAALAPSAARMAEGALDLVPLYQGSDLATILRDLKQRGVFVLGTEPEAGQSLYALSVPRPAVVVVGNERTGLSAKVKHRCDALVRIPGGGTVQSLNVSVALGVVLAELFRTRTKG